MPRGERQANEYFAVAKAAVFKKKVKSQGAEGTDVGWGTNTKYLCSDENTGTAQNIGFHFIDSDAVDDVCRGIAPPRLLSDGSGVMLRLPTPHKPRRTHLCHKPQQPRLCVVPVAVAAVCCARNADSHHRHLFHRRHIRLRMWRKGTSPRERPFSACTTLLDFIANVIMLRTGLL